MTFLIGKQSYDEIGKVAHVRQDGSTGWLTVLRSSCAKCGEPFECKATEQAIAKRWVNRRCKEHCRPGIKVRK